MNNKLIAYIDGANMHKATIRLGWMVDYARLYVWLSDKYKITDAYIFIGRIKKYENLYSKMRDAGFVVIFKEITVDGNGQIKGNCDADLVLYSTRHVFEYYLSQVIIVSSDGDFSSLAIFLKEKGVTVVIISPSNKCSFLLRKLNLPLVYLYTQRSLLEIVSVKEKALDGDGTP
jgi:uncharacterized LabA/DUF88 family protein